MKPKDFMIRESDLFDWLGFKPLKIKHRLLVKWTNWVRRATRPCDHKWVYQYKGSAAGWCRCNKCRALLSHTQEME